MKVLLVSLFHPELIRGGAQQVCYELFEGLREKPGIEVTLLASVEQSYPALFKAGARITGFDGRPNEFLFLARDYDYWWHKSSSTFLVEAYTEFLRDLQPDVVHFHHFLTYGIDFLTLTRTVLPHAKIIFTLHEFLGICAADGQMKRRTDSSICTNASPVRCHQCFPEHGPEKFFMREKWMKSHFASVDAFTTPSRFMIDIYTRWGLDEKKIHHISNGQKNYNAVSAEEAPRARRNRFGFFGQLVDNKGVYLILEAVNLLRNEGFKDFTVEINGDNIRYASEKRRKQIEEFLAEEAERPLNERNVILNGSYHVSQLSQRMHRVDWCIVPSVWNEIFALVISEAWMFKRPVIGSRVGAIAERIRHDVDGLLFDVDDSRALAQAMRRAAETDGLWHRLSGAIPEPPARSRMVEEFCALYDSNTTQPKTVPLRKSRSAAASIT